MCHRAHDLTERAVPLDGGVCTNGVTLRELPTLVEGEPEMAWSWSSPLPSAPVETLAATLSALERQLLSAADEHDFHGFRQAARALHHERSGRKANNDRRDVEEAIYLHETGRARSPWDACLAVAAKYYEGQLSTAKRLHRKVMRDLRKRSAQ